MPPPTNARGLPQSVSVTEENFILAMDAQLSKVEKFTLAKVTELRHDLALVEAKLHKLPENKDELLEETDEIAEAFLRLEKYVNINFMGFHKILKKHDKHVPANPCKVFYVSRLHSQAWVRGDYSDLVVRLSTIYSTIRNDQAAPETADASQSFLRSTTKYWVKTEDVSRVKYAILRHLPVFLQKTSTGESDSQMTNSVYLDNDQLELYHGRLDKSPGAIALRLRWYGAGDPSLVFVERKTHREKWAGETSVKERFVVSTYAHYFFYPAYFTKCCVTILYLGELTTLYFPISLQLILD
jgi:SPX domain protein involved in polyphosphate accumulation